MLLVLINVIVHQRRLVQLIISVHLFFLLFEILLEFIEINYLLVLRVHPQLVYFACRRKLKVDFIAHFLDVFEERLHYLFEHISVWVQTLLVGLSYRSLRLVIRWIIIGYCLLLNHYCYFLLQLVYLRLKFLLPSQKVYSFLFDGRNALLARPSRRDQ